MLVDNPFGIISIFGKKFQIELKEINMGSFCFPDQINNMRKIPNNTFISTLPPAQVAQQFEHPKTQVAQ